MTLEKNGQDGEVPQMLVRPGESYDDARPNVTVENMRDRIKTTR